MKRSARPIRVVWNRNGPNCQFLVGATAHNLFESCDNSKKDISGSWQKLDMYSPIPHIEIPIFHLSCTYSPIHLKYLNLVSMSGLHLSATSKIPLPDLSV